MNLYSTFTMLNFFQSAIFIHVSCIVILFGLIHIIPIFIHLQYYKEIIIRMINGVCFLKNTCQLFINNNLIEFPNINILQLTIYMYKLENHSEFEREHSYNKRNTSQINPTRVSIGQCSLNFSAT